MKKRFKRRKIKWNLSFGKIYLKPKQYRLATETIQSKGSNR